MRQARVALVTGAGRRIGAAIARALFRDGFRLALHYRRSAAEARALARELEAERPGSAACFAADLVQAGAAEALAEAVLARFGRLDALVNNASTYRPTPFGAVDHAAWRELVGANLEGHFFLAQALAPALRAARGAVVNLTDARLAKPQRGYAAYGAAKAGLAALTRVLAVELAPKVRVNGVAPGAILWPEGEASLTEAERAAVLGAIPLGRLGTPEEVAEVVRYLIAEGSYLTGQTLAVDGGLRLLGEPA